MNRGLSGVRRGCPDHLRLTDSHVHPLSSNEAYLSAVLDLAECSVGRLLSGSVCEHSSLGVGKILEIRTDSHGDIMVKVEFQDRCKREFGSQAFSAGHYTHYFHRVIDLSPGVKADAIRNRVISEWEEKNLSEEERRARGIEREIVKRGIKQLVHFTRIENLSSILQHGLVPISKHGDIGIQACINDEYRLDLRRDCTSCSIEFPNFRMFYSLRQSNPESTWVIITITAEVLYTGTNHAYYYQSNAARSDLSGEGTVEAFRSMFASDVDTLNGLRQRSELRIPECFPTDPQAEVLVQGVIGKDFLTAVHFENGLDKEQWVGDHAASPCATVPLKVTPRLFKYRPDYRYWRRT